MIWRVRLPVFADKRVLDPEAWMRYDEMTWDGGSFDLGNTETA